MRSCTDSRAHTCRHTHTNLPFNTLMSYTISTVFFFEFSISVNCFFVICWLASSYEFSSLFCVLFYFIRQYVVIFTRCALFIFSCDFYFWVDVYEQFHYVISADQIQMYFNRHGSTSGKKKWPRSLTRSVPGVPTRSNSLAVTRRIKSWRLDGKVTGAYPLTAGQLSR